MSGEAEPSPRRKPRRVVGGEKGTEVIYFFPFVCLYFDNLHRNLRRFRRCVFSGFVYSPARRENCAVGERRLRRPSCALFFRPTKDVYGLALQKTAAFLCRLQTIQRPHARSAVLSSLLQTDRRGSRRLLSFWPCSLSNAVRFNFGRAVLSFCRLLLFLFLAMQPRRSDFRFPVAHACIRKLRSDDARRKAVCVPILTFSSRV